MNLRNDMVDGDRLKILIIRMSSLGDVLLASPLIKALREKYPRAQIDFLVRSEYAELVKFNPHLSDVIIFDAASGFNGLKRLRRKITRRRYQTILDIHKNLRSYFLTLFLRNSKVHRIHKNQFIRFLLVKWKINLYKNQPDGIMPVWKKYLRAAAPLNIAPDNIHLELFYPEETDEKVDAFIKSLSSGKWEMMIAPGAKHFTKRWPQEYVADFIRIIHEEYGVKTILTGGPDDIAVAEAILARLKGDLAVSAVGKFSVPETAALLHRAKLVLTNDSGLMHVAAAVNVPVLAIFGSTVEEFGFFPLSPRAHVFQNRGLSCRPCTHIGRSSCPQKHFKCMMEVTPAMILKYVREKELLRK